MNFFKGAGVWVLCPVLAVVAMTALSNPVVQSAARGTAETSAPAQVCGDVNGDFLINITDLAYLYSYCFNNGTAPISMVDADMDDYDSVNARDVGRLIEYVMFGSAPPVCPTTNPEYIPAAAPLDTVSFSPWTLPALDSQLTLAVHLKNTSPLRILSLPLQISIDGTIPTIDSAVAASRVQLDCAPSNFAIDTVAGTLNYALMCWTSSLPVGSGDILYIYLSIPPVAVSRAVEIDTLRLSPGISPMFVQPTTLTGTLPVIDFPTQAGICGDVNDDGSIGISDMVRLYAYLFNQGPPPVSPADADVDDYFTITGRDVAVLVDYVFYIGPAPTCPPTRPPYTPTLQTADTLTFAPTALPAFDSQIAVQMLYRSTDTVIILSAPLEFTFGGDIPRIDSTVRGARTLSPCTPGAFTIDSALGRMNFAAFCAGGLVPGRDELLTVHMSIPPVSYVRPLLIDTVPTAYGVPAMFVKRTSLDGVLPVLDLAPTPETNPDTLEFTLFSPVDMAVTDPQGDSIGIGFNTIGDGSTYDSLTDVNTDGDPDDRVTIPNVIPGDYHLRIFREPDANDGDKFTLGIRINGNLEYSPDGYVDRPVAAVGESDELNWTAEATLPGDTNADGTTDAADIVYMVNYVFKSGAEPVVPTHGDVDCNGVTDAADIIRMVNYVFKSGLPPCSQSA